MLRWSHTVSRAARAFRDTWLLANPTFVGKWNKVMIGVDTFLDVRVNANHRYPKYFPTSRTLVVVIWYQHSATRCVLWAPPSLNGIGRAEPLETPTASFHLTLGCPLR